MISIINEQSRSMGFKDGKQLVRAELVCDTCAELAGVTELEGAADG